jgi:1,4-dihydroxy-2-naphthoate polyprenyltransferase
MSKLKPLFGIMRLPFLALTPACVLLGVAAAVWTGGRVNGWQVALLLVGALCAHISVNAFNEYFDFQSGLDSHTCRTPFSGGSGTLPARPELVRLALGFAWSAFAVTALTGLYFVWLRGLALLPLGLLGLFLLVAYTPWLVRNPFLCLVAPGLGFGPLMVLSVAFALTGVFSWTAFVASLVPFFLVSDLLLLNQFPDVEADRRVGRRHFPVLIGRKGSSLIYAAFLLAAYLAIGLGAAFRLLPPASLLGLLGAIIAVPAGINAFRYSDEPGRLTPSLGRNVLLNLATPVLLGLGLLIG